MGSENYIHHFICECGELNKINLTKYQAAFFDSLQVDTKCRACGSTKRSRSSFNDLPKIDDELLTQWLADEKLYFLSQDEDLLMTNISTNRIIQAIVRASPMRARTLFSVLCLKLDSDSFESKDERHATIIYLEENRTNWESLYIRKAVDEKLRQQRNV